MKTLLLITLSLFSSVSFAQVNCNSYLGGVTSCTGPNGYQSESRQHLNGQSSYYDSLGNSGTVTKTLNGGVNSVPLTRGRAAPSPVPVQPAYITSGGLEPIAPPKSDYYYKYQQFNP
jgi:hypothetical protein